MRSSPTDDERGHLGALEALVSREALEGAGRRVLGDVAAARLGSATFDAAATLRISAVRDDDPTLRGDRAALRDALDALEGAKVDVVTMAKGDVATTAKRERVSATLAARMSLFDADEDDPTIRGDRRALQRALAGATCEDELSPPLDDDPWAPIEGADYDPQITLRGDCRAAALTLRSVAAPHPASFAHELPMPPPLPLPPRAEPPALPLPLVRRADRWLEELPEAARRVLEEARALRPSWPLQERAEGVVLVPKQKIPSLRSAP
ncbi:MAG: hypothetical protein KF901_27060 [Myxococcales bacterium]|nr:hypothetical protein [Myxococcales bacterium]